MAKELNKFMLSAIAIIGLTVIVLIGIAITTAFSKELRTPTTTNASDVVAVASLAATNTSNTLVTTYPFLQELTLCGNETNLSSTEGSLLLTSYYAIGEGNAGGGTITLNQDGVEWVGVSINCSNIGYLANSDGQIAADKFSTGLGIFGTFSVIIILAIVGKAIISLFRKKD